MNLYIIISLISACSLAGEQISAGTISDAENYLDTLNEVDEKLTHERKPDEISSLLLKKSYILCKNQRLPDAQEAFLEAIERYPVTSITCESPDEKRQVYDHIPLYLKAVASPQDMKKLEDESFQILQQHPDFHSVRYFLSAVSANRNDFSSFFDHFYKAYQARPDCYLAWKMRGVLHLRLFETSSEEGKRLWHRDRAVECFQKAFSLYPSDASLIVKMVFLLPPEGKKKLLVNFGNDISNISLPLQRGECIYLVQEALKMQLVDVAKKIIEKTNSWYGYSRAIQELSKQIACSE